MKIILSVFQLLCLWCLSSTVSAACRDAVVLVHGNTASPSSFDNTYNELRSRGYASSEIFRPNWGNKNCAACNNHSGSEETPVRNAISDALNRSCTGKIDVIGHSMGATLAAQQIRKLGVQSQVDAYVAIAAAYRGLWTCGTYPYNVWNATCGYYGLSVNSPFLLSIRGKSFGARMYSIKSWVDQVVCATGTCTVGGKHSSRIDGEKQSYSYNYGHFGLQTYTASRQVDLIQ